MICRGNQLTGFYMRGTLIVKGLNLFRKVAFNNDDHSYLNNTCIRASEAYLRLPQTSKLLFRKLFIFNVCENPGNASGQDI